MYHAQFGLERSLFGDGIAADAAVFRSPKHDQISAHFKLALGSPSSCLVLRGPAGVGKTTLASAALRASSTRLALAWLNAAPTNAAELLELLLVELGVDTAGTTRIDRLQLWRQFQGEMRATESRLFIVVERTEDLACEILHALDSLTAADAAGNLGANVVLLGHAGIDEHLSAPVLESLRQRIRLRAELTPFTEAELQDYLRHQVACAGGHFDHVFAPGTVAALHRHSGGVARLANTLCATALEVAASQQQKLLTAELLTKTAVSMLGLTDAAPAARNAPPAVSVATAAPETPPVVVLAAPAVEPPKTVAPVAPPASTPPIAGVAAAVPTAAAAPSPAAAPAPAAIAAAPPTPTAARATPAPVTAAPPALPVASAPTSQPAAPPAPALTEAPTPILRATLPPVSAPAPIVEFEFDGGATDITDVAMADFPVLTDAVELPPLPQRAATPAPPAPSPVAAEPAAAAPKTPAAKPRVRAPVAAPPPPAAKPVSSRLETAYAPSKASAPKPAAAAAAKPTQPTTPAPVPTLRTDSDDDDVLRQTQTMRAIAVAKSIDDISSSMAETLFGDAELDLVTAALASAAEWPDGDEQPAAPAPRTPEPAKPAATAPRMPEPAKPAAPVDDPFDLFGLGDDAPLELIDDSTLPPTGVTRKTAAR